MVFPSAMSHLTGAKLGLFQPEAQRFTNLFRNPSFPQKLSWDLFWQRSASKCKLKLTNPESAQTQVWHAGLLLNVTWNKKVGDLYLDSHLIYANPIRPREDKSNWNMWLQFLLPARTEFPWLPGQSISPEKGLEYDDKSISRQTEMNSLSAKLFNGQDLATCPELSVRQQSEYSSLWESLLQINSWNWSDVPA